MKVTARIAAAVSSMLATAAALTTNINLPNWAHMTLIILAVMTAGIYIKPQ